MFYSQGRRAFFAGWAIIGGESIFPGKGGLVNLFIGNLSRDVTESELRELFAPFGKLVSVSVVKDKFSGVSKGFGFVEMAEKAEAEAAITALHRTPLKGQSMDITEARPREQRKGGHGSRGRGVRRRSS